MREIAIPVAGIGIGIVWLLVWSAILHWSGVLAFATRGNLVQRRECMRRMGKARYILIFGVWVSGVAFALAVVAMDFSIYGFSQLRTELMKAVFYALGFGLCQGFFSWRNAFREPVPFPPDYPPMK